MAESKVLYKPIGWKYLGRDSQQNIPPEATEILVLVTTGTGEGKVRGGGIIPNIQIDDYDYPIVSGGFISISISANGEINASLSSTGYTGYMFYWK